MVFASSVDDFILFLRDIFTTRTDISSQGSSNVSSIEIVETASFAEASDVQLKEVLENGVSNSDKVSVSEIDDFQSISLIPEEAWVKLSNLVGALSTKICQRSGIDQQIPIKVSEVWYFVKVQMGQFFEIVERVFGNLWDRVELSSIEVLQSWKFAEITALEVWQANDVVYGQTPVVLEPHVQVLWKSFQGGRFDHDCRHVIVPLARDVLSRNRIHDIIRSEGSDFRVALINGVTERVKIVFTDKFYCASSDQAQR